MCVGGWLLPREKVYMIELRLPRHDIAIIMAQARIEASSGFAESPRPLFTRENELYFGANELQ